MNTRNTALLEEAKQQGYLVMRYGYNDALLSQYFEWCRSEIIPAIYVWFHGLSASIDSNTDPVFNGYSMEGKFLTSNPSFNPTPELYERCHTLFDRCTASMLRSPRQASVHLSGCMAAYYIDQEMAVEAAKELWAIWQEAKQHIVFEFEEDEMRLTSA